MALARAPRAGGRAGRLRERESGAARAGRGWLLGCFSLCCSALLLLALLALAACCLLSVCVMCVCGAGLNALAVVGVNARVFCEEGERGAEEARAKEGGGGEGSRGRSSCPVCPELVLLRHVCSAPLLPMTRASPRSARRAHCYITEPPREIEPAVLARVSCCRHRPSFVVVRRRRDDSVERTAPPPLF